MIKSMKVVAFVLMILIGAMGLRNIATANAASVSGPDVVSQFANGGGPIPPPNGGGPIPPPFAPNGSSTLANGGGPIPPPNGGGPIPPPNGGGPIPPPFMPNSGSN